MSAAKRTYSSDTDVDIPGPGTYDGLAPLRPRGYAPVRASRFRNEIPKMPGPADYEVSDEENRITACPRSLSSSV